MTEQLSTISELIPDVILDLRYTTTNNVAGKVIAAPQPMLRPEANGALQAAATVFRTLGYRLVIWDAYRTEQTQQALLSVIHDPKYVSPDSNHIKGLAVDITLADAEGNYLDMGTDFDDFSPKAHSDSNDVTPLQRQNRLTLCTVMHDHGFTVWPYEWWHFNFTGSK